jgi:hypothetical protein
MSRASLIRVLGTIQNSAEHFHHDIMTFAAFLDDAELNEHVMANFKLLGLANRQRVIAYTANMGE